MRKTEREREVESIVEKQVEMESHGRSERNFALGGGGRASFS